MKIGDSLFHQHIGHVADFRDNIDPSSRGSSPTMRRHMDRREAEFEALYSHERSQKVFGLTPKFEETTNRTFLLAQLMGFANKIKTRQQNRVFYTNLLATSFFFCVYVSVIFQQRKNVPEQAMLLKSFMNSIISDLPADSQGFYSSGLGTSGFLRSQQDFIDWLNNSIIQTIFTDEKCGDGLCNPSEYLGVGRFGCENDCGPQPNQTEIIVNLQSFVKSRPVLNSNKWDISRLTLAADPAFRFNIFSESLQDYLFDRDMQEGEDATVNVLDGTYYLELYQTQKVSTLFSKESFFSNSFILANTVPPREAKTDFAYGDYREFLAVSASIVDSAVNYCFGPDLPLLPSGEWDSECDHFFQESFFVRAFSGYGLSGSVSVRSGNQEPVSLVDVSYCGVFPNGSMGLGGLRRYFRGNDLGLEWVVVHVLFSSVLMMESHLCVLVLLVGCTLNLICFWHSGSND
jgi:hypothetical protein